MLLSRLNHRFPGLTGIVRMQMNLLHSFRSNLQGGKNTVGISEFEHDGFRAQQMVDRK
jgi:hypothetical protein